MTTSLTLVRKIKAQPATVYEALTQPDLIARWWGPDAGPVLKAEADVRIGGAFRVRFRMLNGDEHESHGIYREVVPEARLVFTWQWVTMDDPESLVTIELRPIEDGGTELTLTHAQLRDEVVAFHREGWSGALDKLVRLYD